MTIIASGSAGSTGSSGVTSVSTPIPADAWEPGTVGGLAYYTTQPTNGTSIVTPPAGFEEVFNAVGNSSVRLVVFAKALDDSDLGSDPKAIWSASNATVAGWVADTEMMAAIIAGTGGQSGTAVPTVIGGTAVDPDVDSVIHIVGMRNNTATGQPIGLNNITGAPDHTEFKSSARTGTQRNGGAWVSRYNEGPDYLRYQGTPDATYSHIQMAFLMKPRGVIPGDIATTTSLVVNPMSTPEGQNATATATVHPVEGGAPTGSIKFETNTGSGWSTLGTVPLAARSASISVPAALGETQVRAEYLPNTGWVASISPVVVLTGTPIAADFGLEVKVWNGTIWVDSEMRTQESPGVWVRRVVQVVEAAAGALLRFPPPTLSNPQTINVPTGMSKFTCAMTSGVDYIINLPAQARGQVVLQGGRNVVLIGGQIANDPSLANDNTADSANRGIYITNGSNTGSTAERIVHIEGVLFTGPHFSDLIQIADRDENNLRVQLQNLRCDGITYGAEARPPWAHSDAVQCYGGPATLRMHRCTFNNNTYQGLFANDADGRTLPTGHEPWELHDLYFGGSSAGPDAPERYLITDIQGPRATNTSNIYVGRTNTSRFSPADSYAGAADWDWHDGLPPGGDFVPVGVAGLEYVSPGYEG